MKVPQSCPTLCSMDHTVYGILQVRILEWVAFPFSRGSSQPRNQTQVSCTAGGFFASWAKNMFVDKQLSLFKNFLTFMECVYIHNIYVHTCTHILNVCADTVCTHAFTFPAKCNWDSLSTLRKNVMVEKVTEACKSTIHYSCLQISINTTIFCAVIWLNMVPKKCCCFFPTDSLIQSTWCYQ